MESSWSSFRNDEDRRKDSQLPHKRRRIDHHDLRGVNSHARMLRRGKALSSLLEDGYTPARTGQYKKPETKRQEISVTLDIFPPSDPGAPSSDLLSDVLDLIPPRILTDTDTSMTSQESLTTATTTTTSSISSESDTTSSSVSSTITTQSEDSTTTSSFYTSSVTTDVSTSSSESSTTSSFTSSASSSATPSSYSSSSAISATPSSYSDTVTGQPSWSSIPWPPSQSSSAQPSSGSVTSHSSSHHHTHHSHTSSHHSESRSPSASSAYTHLPPTTSRVPPTSSSSSSRSSSSHAGPSGTVQPHPHPPNGPSTTSPPPTSSELPSSLVTDSPTSHSGFSKNTAAIVGVSVTAGVVILALGLALFFFSKRYRRKQQGQAPPPTVSRANLIGVAGWRSPLRDEDEVDYPGSRENVGSSENGMGERPPMSVGAHSNDGLGLVGMGFATSSSSHGNSGSSRGDHGQSVMGQSMESGESGSNSGRTRNGLISRSATMSTLPPLLPEARPSSLLNPPRPPTMRESVSDPLPLPPPLWHMPTTEELPAGLMYMQDEVAQGSLLDNIDYSRPIGALYRRMDSNMTTSTLQSAHSDASADDGHI